MISTCVKIHQRKKLTSAILEQGKLNITLRLCFNKKIKSKLKLSECLSTWFLLALHPPLLHQLKPLANLFVNLIKRKEKGSITWFTDEKFKLSSHTLNYIFYRDMFSVNMACLDQHWWQMLAYTWMTDTTCVCFIHRVYFCIFCPKTNGHKQFKRSTWPT